METNSLLRRRDAVARRRRQALASLLGVWACASSVPAASVPEPLAVCMKVARDAERLKCYDRALESLATGRPPASVTVSAEEVFGAAALESSLRRGNTAHGREQLESIASTVRSLLPVGEGLLVIQLENGQVWRQDEERALQIKVGDTVRVTRAALGTFRIVDSRGRFARFRRVR